MAAACWLSAVETTRAIKVDEPGSTGTLKFAMITLPFPDASIWVDATAEETKKLLATSKSSAASKPKVTEMQKYFRLIFDNLLPFLAIQKVTYKVWHNYTVTSIA
jgi:hypothetical protein